ncbi:hypothetical protein BHE90_006894 [Fusarium euwallaceae]|uniref:Uncharacterized protein n=3 Tax=Fusarium solani species complex TaxID=232080 RepID=A0A3M2SQ60_9HYPO|nr:hypothetical protein CDV36_000567 [Fusarium kuroshium]RSL50701.1 hypothetical protein CEP51_015309 [Fusarium floridanum]RTE78615.1 hypothetical protein BHE90_006894 [Fusarium euwallaceae]
MDDNSSQPNVDVDAPDDDALMAQMGFSSFGAASPPSKRRRYNPRADASLPPKPPKPSATGANSTALGTGSNTDEIALDDDDEPAQQPAQVRPASLPQRPAPAADSRQGHHQSQPHGTRDTWYVGYYDPTSNENPWERLEKARGLEPQGTWLPRGAPSTATTGAPS